MNGDDNEEYAIDLEEAVKIKDEEDSDQALQVLMAKKKNTQSKEMS